MKRIDALIHLSQWEISRDSLENLGVPVTLREVKTVGRTPPRREVYRGTAYYSPSTPELELTMIVQDERLEATLTALEPLVVGGELFVSSIESQIRRPAAPQPARAAELAKQRAAVPSGFGVPRHA